MKKVYLNKETITKLSHNEFMACTALKEYVDINWKAEKGKIPTQIIECINVDFLIYTLTGSMEETRCFKESLTKGLDKLIENNVIYLVEKNNKNYVLDLVNLYIDAEKGDEYFTTSDDEIKDILAIETKDRFSLFHYAFTVLSTIWNGDKGFGCNTIDDLCFKCEISKSAGLDYNELLEKAHLIYVKRNPVSCRQKDGTIKRQANTYGRYENMDIIIDASKKYNTRAYDMTKRLDSNKKISIKALYNSYIKDTYKGSIKSLYEDALKYNDDHFTKLNKCELDLTMFPTEFDEDEVKEVKVKKYKPKGKSDIFKADVIEDDNPFGDYEENIEPFVDYVPKETNDYDWDLEHPFD